MRNLLFAFVLIGLFLWPKISCQDQPALPSLDNAAPSSTTLSPQRYAACLSACRTLSYYNPVCGSDGISYDNEQRLNCAVRCGQNVRLLQGGRCDPVT